MDYMIQYLQLDKNANNITMQPNSKLINKPMMVFKGFIGKDTIIKPYSNPSSGFKLDDEELYKGFINIAIDKPRNFAQDVSLIQNYIDEYFGNNNNVEKVKNEHQDIHSINAYKNVGGECIHKSAIGNNLLQILGYDCEIIWSNIGSENHSFLIVHDGDKQYIFDPANRSKLFVNDTNYYKIPTLVEKSNEEIESFLNNRTNLTISEEDEKAKNQKQANNNYKIVLPKITYSCRTKTEYISLNKQKDKNKDIIDNYIDSLRAKGLSSEEICNVLEKIKNDAEAGLKPKVESLNEVYNAMKPH